MRKKVVLGMIILGMIGASASAAITVVNSASAYERIEPTLGGVTNTSLTVTNFDAGSSSDTYIVISVAFKMKYDTNHFVLSTTFNDTPIPLTASKFADDDYTGWASLYIAPAQGSGDVVVTYETSTSNSYDAVSISVASYSGVNGINAISPGSSDAGAPNSLSDSITTTGEDSLVVSSIMASGHDVPSMTGTGSTVVRVDNAVDGMGNGLLELSAPTAGAYVLGATFIDQFRAAMISTELSATPDAVPNTNVVAIMKRVFDWQLADTGINGRTWDDATFYAGISAAYRATQDTNYLAAIVSMGEGGTWRPNRRINYPDDGLHPDNDSDHPDDQCVGQTYIDLYLMQRDIERIQPIQAAYDAMIADTNAPALVFWWCDSLFMNPPGMARLATATADPTYLDAMNTNFWISKNYLYDPVEDLFFRDDRFFNSTEANGEKVFWSRGNGWVLAGLSRILQFMPSDYPDWANYVSLFQEMSVKIASLQQSDGFWRSSLLDPDSYPDEEASGTAFFTYALAWGINQELLSSETYLPVVTNGWNALCSVVETNGMLGAVQAEGARPAATDPANAEPYASGGFLMAGSEVLKLIPMNP